MKPWLVEGINQPPPHIPNNPSTPIPLAFLLCVREGEQEWMDVNVRGALVSASKQAGVYGADPCIHIMHIIHARTHRMHISLADGKREYVLITLPLTTLGFTARMHLFIYSFIHLFIHSFIRMFYIIHTLHPFTHSCTHSTI